MKTEDLRDRVVFTAGNNPEYSRLAKGQYSYVAVGPLTKQPSSLPYRTVLVATENQFIVYSEIWYVVEYAPDNSLKVHPLASHFSEGNYFNAHELHNATEQFAERIKQDAAHIQSIYREPGVTPSSE